MPRNLPAILQEIAIGAVVGVIAVIVWVLAIGPGVTPWQYLAANAVILVVAGLAASAWSRWRAGRRESQEARR